MGRMVKAPNIFNTASNLSGLIILVLAGFSVSSWRRDRDRSRRLETGFLLLFSGLLLLSYSFYIFGSFFFVRYYFPVYFVGSILFAFFLQDIIDRYKRSSLNLRRIAVSAVSVYAAVFIYFSWSQSFRSWPAYPFYDVAAWVNRNTEKDDRIGVLQCGMIGYFSDRRVINLDGKVNREALKAMKKDDLIEYVREEKIDIIIDHSRILQIFLDLPPEKIKNYCTPIPGGEMGVNTGWIAYRPDFDGINQLQ
jgi:hypothetical protein